MTEKNCNNELQTVEKQEVQPAQAEHTRERRVYTPRTDIYETHEDIVVLADMPGVHDQNVDITLEQNTLILNGFVEASPHDGHSLTYGEYGIGDYYRQFTLPNAVDREAISATMKNGVLKLVLPKSTGAKLRKITVRGEG
jgi:HSP20 family molecular chaperone IbpA